MKINKKKIIITITIICIAWVYNLVIFMGSQTKKTLFFRQQSDVSEDGNIEIKCLEKIQLEDPIVKVRFPELSGEEIDWRVHSGMSENNISYKSMEIFLGDEQIKEKLGINKLIENGNIVITKMIYTTQSGKEEEVNLGKITIDKKFIYDKKYKILNNSGINGSSDNRGINYYEPKDKLKIIDIEGENLETINKFFNIYINEEKLENIKLPMQLEREGNIAVSYELKKNLTDKDFDLEQYNMQLKLKCSDPEGTIDYMITDLKVDIGELNKVTKPSFVKKIKNRLEEN